MSKAKTFKPSRKLLVKFRLWVGLIFICIFPFIFLGFIPGLGWTYVWIFLVANAVWMIPAFALIPAYYRSVEYELGDEEVVVHVGIITKTIKTVPYRTVTNIEVKRGLLDRWLGIGGISVHTAGYSAQGGPEIKLSGLEGYEGIHSEISTALRRFRARGGTATFDVGETPASVQDVPQLLTNILEELRALRRSLDHRD